MKKKIILVISAALVLVFINAAFSSPAASVGVVTKIIQNVEYKSSAFDDWSDAKTGEVLYDGDEVRTGNRSLALLKFLDNSLLRLRENSIVTIYGTKSGSLLNKNTFIKEGEVGFEVEKQEEEEFKFTTPTGVASIRGTSGYFEVKADGSTLLYVKEGEVQIESSIGTKESGSVGAGRVAAIGADGSLKIDNASDNEVQKFNKLKKDKVKKVKIKTNTGEEYILEFLE